MPKRSYSAAGSYRYGFNGKENDNDVKGLGNQQDYGMRIYDARVGRFLSEDPISMGYPELTPYQFASNRPIDGIDLDGLEYMSHISQYPKKGNDWDYLKAVPNAAGRLWNFLVVDTYNSGVANFQSIRRGTWGQDISNEIRQIGTAVKNEYNALQKTTKKQFAKDFFNYAVSPQGVEDMLFNSFFVFGPKGITRGPVPSVSNGVTVAATETLPLITVVEEDGYAIIRDVSQQIAGRAWLSTGGELNLTIKTVGTGLKGKGAEVFNSLYKFVSENFDKVSSIRGTWRAGMLGDNLTTFNKLVKSGISETEAALQTYTGKMASRLGYNKVKIGEKVVGADGTYKSVDVLFLKE